MKNSYNEKECLIYPGVYTPLYPVERTASPAEEVMEHPGNDFPIVNIIETAVSFLVEIVLPGANREEIGIKASGNILTISLIPRDASQPLHESGFKITDRQVILPENSDTEFISAEYSAGILRLFVPKTLHPIQGHSTKIAVY